MNAHIGEDSGFFYSSQGYLTSGVGGGALPYKSDGGDCHTLKG